MSGRTQTDVVVSPTTGVTAGVEAFGERARSTYVVGEAGQEVPIERRILGAFGEVRQDIGARASLTGGLRVDAIRRNALEGDPNPFGPRPDFADESVTSVNPRFAGKVVAWQDGRGVARTTLRASAGTGIRPPDAFEIAFTDNPDLKPERSRSMDVGVSHVVVPQVTVEATAFFNRYDDLIIAVGQSFVDASRYRTDNISNARARGVELEGAWRGPRGVSARLVYTFLDTEILAVDQSDEAPAALCGRRPAHPPAAEFRRRQRRVDGHQVHGVRHGARARRGTGYRAVLRRLRRPLHRSRLHRRRRGRQLAGESAGRDLRPRTEPVRPRLRRGVRLPRAPAAWAWSDCVSISARNLTFAYPARAWSSPGRPVLRDVSVDVPSGARLGILGPNGSGKTTLLKLLAGVLTPSAGQVTLDDVPLGRLSRQAIARRLAMVPQETHPAFDYTVLELVLMGRYPHLGRFSVESAADIAIAHEALAATGTLEFASRLFSTLSGGEKQRVVIASSLAQQAELLLLDEPTASLDPGYQLEVADLLRVLQSTRGIGLVLSTHDLNLAAAVCDRLILLRGGEVIASGTTAEVLTRDRISALYDIEADVRFHDGADHLIVVPMGRRRR